MSEIRSQTTPARDELAADIREVDGNHSLGASALADLLVDRGWSKPRTVTSAAELDALPVGAVVHSAAGTIAAKLDRTEGVVFGIHRSFQWSGLALPATVLFTPGEAG